MGGSGQTLKQRWYAVPARAIFVALLLTLLTFAVTLLISIAVMVIRGWLHGGNPDMRVAYRYFALPVAMTVGAVALITSLVVEIQHYRRSRALAGIARASR
jgi:hypothetical protein